MRELTHDERMERLTLGWFIKRDPTLEEPIYSPLQGVYADFLAHINSHPKVWEGSAVSDGPWGGDPVAILKTCRFCQILKKDEEENAVYDAQMGGF